MHALQRTALTGMGLLRRRGTLAHVHALGAGPGRASAVRQCISVACWKFGGGTRTRMPGTLPSLLRLVAASRGAHGTGTGAGAATSLAPLLPYPPRRRPRTATNAAPTPAHPPLLRAHTAQQLQGFDRGTWYIFERVLITRDLATGGGRTFLNVDDAREFRELIYKQYGEQYVRPVPRSARSRCTASGGRRAPPS